MASAEGEGAAAAPARGLTYTDTDGTVMQWDPAMRAYFPKIDETFMASYQMGYGINQAANPWTVHKSPEGHTYYYNSATKQSSWTMPAEFQAAMSQVASAATARPSYQDMVDQERIRKEMAGDSEDEPKAKKSKKEEKEEGFFTLDKTHNSFVYIQGLPVEDFDEEKLVKFMSKCGVVALDDEGIPKAKLYRNETGGLKGDGRLCYLKVESVNLALTLLDDTEITPGHKVKITRAEFTAKEGVDVSKAKKKPKKKKGKADQKQLQSKRLLGWHEEEESNKVRKKAAGVVVIKHMFKPDEFDENAMYLNDIRDDLQSECSKFGPVKKIMIFDRHPDGVVSVKFEDMESAHRCIKVMHNRFFAGNKLSAEMWDGHTSYKIEESDLEREQRIKKWEKDLEEG